MAPAAGLPAPMLPEAAATVAFEGVVEVVDECCGVRCGSDEVEVWRRC